MEASFKSNGFTLIELMAVLMIIGILSTVVFFNWSPTYMNLAAQEQQLANDIHFAQSLSMTTGQRYRWVKISSNTYQIMNSAGTPILLAMGSTTATLNGNITFGTLTNLPNNLVAFDGTGAPYSTTGSPGTALAATAVIPLTSGGDTETVSITPQTGQVTAS